MTSEWSEIILRNFHQPQQVGELAAAPNVYRALAEINGGDKVQLDVAIENDKISDVRYQVYGCPAMIACMSWLATELRNKTCAEATQITAHKISTALTLPARKFRCAVLAESVLFDIMQQYKK